jgi:ribose-phosphate pyrophosphokinase
MNIIGDVKDRTCMIMDDMVDTANTLCEAANALKANGAKRSSPIAPMPCCPAARSSGE